MYSFSSRKEKKEKKRNNNNNMYNVVHEGEDRTLKSEKYEEFIPQQQTKIETDQLKQLTTYFLLLLPYNGVNTHIYIYIYI